MNLTVEEAAKAVADTLCTDGEMDCKTGAPEPEYFYTLETRVLMTFIFSFFTIIGVVGNCLVILVVFRVKGMLSDLVLTLDAPFPYGWLGCKLFSYLPYLAINTSSLAITAFTIERFIGICYPIRARYMCTVSRAKLIIAVIWITSFLYNAPWIFLVRLQDDIGCNYIIDRDSNFYRAIYGADFVLFYFIPMIANIIIYVRIAITLTGCSTSLKNGAKHLSGDADEKIPPPGTTAPRDFAVSGRRSSTRGKNQVVKMLALVVIVFASCWLPYRAMVMYNSFAHKSWKPEWYIFFSKTLIYINCAINPILYNVMSVRFRNAFKQLLKRTPAGFTQAHNTVVSVVNGTRLPPHKESGVLVCNGNGADAEQQRLIIYTNDSPVAC